MKEFTNNGRQQQQTHSHIIKVYIINGSQTLIKSMFIKKIISITIYI